jgi:hypothetical protein
MARIELHQPLGPTESERAILQIHQPVPFTNVKLGIRDASVCFTCHHRLDEPDDWPEDVEWSFPVVQESYPCRTLRLLRLA